MKTRIYKESFFLTPHPFFFIGFFYYLLSPPIFYSFVSSDNLLAEVIPLYNESSFNLEYYLDCLVIALFFLVGYFSAKSIKVKTFARTNPNLSALKIIFLSLCFSLFFMTFSFRDVLFQGYREFDVFSLGFINSILLLVTFILILLSERAYYKIGFLFWFFFVAVLLFSGARNISIAASITVVLFFALKNAITIRQLFFLAVTVLFFTVFFGIYRLGFSFDLSSVLIHFFADSFFISASSMCVLEQGRDFISVDYSFLGVFVAWIPSFLFESKYEFLSQLGLHSSASCSPFGGAGLVGQLYSNFSYFYFLYVFVVGLYYGYIYKKFIKQGGIYTAVYLLSIPLLMFHFYNQNIYAYLKILLFNILIFSLLIVILSSLFKLRSQSVFHD